MAKFWLYSGESDQHVARSLIYLHHGKSEKETPPEDVEAQTAQTPQS